MNMITYGSGVKEDPWLLKTPSLSSQFSAWKRGDGAESELVVVVGNTQLSYQWRALEDAQKMLIAHGDWMLLGNADEGKPVKPDTIEEWARSDANPVGGYYGLRKGYRGRFANYATPMMELLGLIELEHNARNNRARAVPQK